MTIGSFKWQQSATSAAMHYSTGIDYWAQSLQSLLYSIRIQGDICRVSARQM